MYCSKCLWPLALLSIFLLTGLDLVSFLLHCISSFLMPNVHTLPKAKEIFPVDWSQHRHTSCIFACLFVCLCKDMKTWNLSELTTFWTNRSGQASVEFFINWLRYKTQAELGFGLCLEVCLFFEGLFVCLFLTQFIYVTSFREQDEAYINSLGWSTLVGLELAYTRMWVACSITPLYVEVNTMISRVTNTEQINWILYLRYFPSEISL